MKPSLLALARISAIAIALCSSAFVAPVQADWTTIPLPPLAATFSSYQMGHLPDGRLVYGSQNDLDRQSSFGSSTLLDYTTAGSWDPSDIAVFSDTLAVLGQGTFAASKLFRFDPSQIGTGFTEIAGGPLQNYSLSFYDAASLLVGGGNGTSGRHAILHVPLDGGARKILLDDISLYSGAFTLDLQGNLYVVDDDDLKLYKILANELATALASSSPLTLNGRSALTTLAADGSLAVDSLGRVWSAGYQFEGLDLFDPSSGTSTRFLPENNPSVQDFYVVSTFSSGTQSYVAYLNAEGPNAGASLSYGYDQAANLVPEPSAATLVLLAFAAGAACARKRALRKV
jgi:hypothetical protein